MSGDKRKPLGRGLGALLPGAPHPAANQQPAPRRDYFVAAIEDVHPSALNPRREFEPQALDELVSSIREHGVLQPLVVRTRSTSEGGGFALIAGERRWRAAQKAGLREVPVVVKEASDLLAFELALVENLQRRDLNPIEEAEAFHRLVEEHDYTHDRLAERVGKDRTTIANALRLLKLPPRTRTMVADARISMGHARALLGLEQAQLIDEAAEEVLREALSVRQTEAMVKRRRKPTKGASPSGEATPPGKTPNVRDLETRLSRSLGGMRVNVRQKAGTTGGTLEIAYGSLDDLDRVLDRLLSG